ncbi:helix-turn-helix transcriptional regulator [Microcoleus sp. FACHB-1515]|uniref:helix-turn-helix domain-containing protein n=1 Tax=Cyanophyceae TaxID=3028117 RepID=UPI001686D609|nr:helix-turn-helix transcriptional regulator [Microcoleus sp. FACHB-1515]MBD2092282.1 helix-turn-helix transcriptional regulator [Microcoleus sp. FACHB-1515]
MSGSVYSQRYQAFLQRLKAARRAAGLTQQAVAEQLNVPQSYVSKCESGERRVDVIELTEFALLYQRSLTYFAYGQDDPTDYLGVDLSTPR